VAARVVAGAFGGPATALALAIIGEVVPPERRGRALGAVMGAFAVASVLGVPAGLELARLGGFRLPFFAVAGAGALVATGALVLMPPLTGHLRQAALTPAGTGRLLAQPTVVCALLAAGTAMMANFALIPNLSAYWLFNLGYPRERLGLLYLVGGAVSFAAMRLAGWLVDRAGAAVVATGGTALYVAVLACGFILPAAWLPVMALFVGFMLTGTFRLVPLQTLATRVPGPGERARFLSIQTVVQHLSAASGAMLAARMLGELPGGRLVGMDRVAWFSVGAGCALPPLLWFVEVQVRRRERSRAAGEALRVPA
jgi:predicted MFS family arabinose efflux permease